MRDLQEEDTSFAIDPAVTITFWAVSTVLALIIGFFCHKNRQAQIEKTRMDATAHLRPAA
eukprot:snap_masked-scaffold_19-processed-gene-4.6-mRNA-1 protein AED:1.00 eAED:1.00 QI:0/-1/0/0/-1/1/1/0/59